MRRSGARAAWVATVLATLAMMPVVAQDVRTDAQSGEVESLQRLATERLRKEVGTWTTRWTFLDAAGNVVNEVDGTEVRSFVIDDRVLPSRTISRRWQRGATPARVAGDWTASRSRRSARRRARGEG